MYKKKLLLLIMTAVFIFAVGCAEEYEINLEIDPGGAGVAMGSGAFEREEVVTVEAEPKDGYIFDKWLENGEVVSTDKSFEFQVEGDRHLTARFAEDIRNLSLMAVGDIMVHNIQYIQAFDESEGIYDFNPSFEFVASYFNEADLVIGNLETTFGGSERGYSSYPRFNSPDELAYNLKDAGMDLLATANNHSLDSSEQGVYRTLDVLEDAGIIPVGTARDEEERDTPKMVEVNGIKLAFLAYTYGTNMIPVPDGKEYIVNLIDLELMRKDIEKAREEGVDMIVVFMHWGIEYQHEPNKEQKELAHELAKAGADIILGSHPHVIQPMDYINVIDDDSKERETFVIYSLGNFISSQYKTGGIPTGDVEYGVILDLNVAKNFATGESYIENTGSTITWVHRGWNHRIIPLNEFPDKSHDKYNISAGKKYELLEDGERLLSHLESYLD